MNLKNYFVLSFTMLILLSACKQDCECESNFAWTKKTFEENDAGFQYILNKKGEQAYDIHNKLIAGKIKSAKNNAECAKILNEWLAFFRSGHIGLTREDGDYFKSVSTEKPYLEEINETTLLLRIPSFMISEKKDIDDIILFNKEKILRTENLIIDLRNNGGGADQSFNEILPLIYTNPIRTIGVEFLSTKQNNKYLLDITLNPDMDKSSKEWAKKAYDILEQQLGEFVNINPDIINIYKQDKINTYPKNVAILINNGNASTTEQFLLAAKQSKKVKLFGVTTSGALDFSNVCKIESPSKEFQLWYCISKSHRIPKMTIDEIGIQPDYYLDETIYQNRWVEFVTEILIQK